MHRHYQAEDTFRPAPATSSNSSCTTSFTKQQTSASLKSTSDNSAQTSISTSRPHHPKDQLTKDRINRDIDHPASAIYASPSSTIFSYVFDRTIQLHQSSRPSCRQELIDSRVYDFLQHRPSTLQRLHGHYPATVILHPRTSFMYDSPNKDLIFNLIHLFLSFV